METIDLPLIQPLHSIHRTHGDYEDLLDWGNFRYHLLLQFNKTYPQADENVALESLWAALSADDEDAIDAAAQQCFDILFPFMKHDYSSRSRSNACTDQVVKLQAVTRNGVLQAIQHDRHIKYPINDPIDNTFPYLPVFPASEIEPIGEIVWRISKIRLRNSIYCLKSVHRGAGERALKRELSILPRCSHSNIVRFIGLVEPVGQKHKVEGIIIEYIQNAKSLRDADSITSVQCRRWTGQIRSAIEYLHANGLVWGDAKADNVLIREGSDVVLIDFGGGFTPGWVEQANSDTVQGDWQGFERIVEFMKQIAV
jgi:tRNA A-37 threonylcarbamoyl transferase component Bud32